ncbi:hypothetical protein EVAR_17094_1 [Eumeta japonica]|uniref:Uncharacterized protein n=1 Tax=Eumeta variegata TaxID=151549 RepID=A0A4C1V5W7_EUMVA|nr:hypothetical protein EVAR_17094_1 [Eumeta japonica]
MNETAVAKLATKASQWRKIGTRGRRRKVGKALKLRITSFAGNSERQSFVRCTVILCSLTLPISRDLPISGSVSVVASHAKTTCFGRGCAPRSTARRAFHQLKTFLNPRSTLTLPMPSGYDRPWSTAWEYIRSTEGTARAEGRRTEEDAAVRGDCPNERRRPADARPTTPLGP